MGLWKVAPIILFLIDLLYPSITRTLLQFATCRDLGSAGFFLEADCTSLTPNSLLEFLILRSLTTALLAHTSDSVQCSFAGNPTNDAMRRYDKYKPHVSFFAFAFSLGIPMSFLFLVYKFKRRGKMGDEQVINALAWIYSPLRDGKEWWYVAEQLRILALSSTIGFVASECWMKTLSALLIALAFLVVFLVSRPYRRWRHTFLQMASMATPIVSMAPVNKILPNTFVVVEIERRCIAQDMGHSTLTLLRGAHVLM